MGRVFSPVSSEPSISGVLRFSNSRLPLCPSHRLPFFLSSSSPRHGRSFFSIRFESLNSLFILFTMKAVLVFIALFVCMAAAMDCASKPAGRSYQLSTCILLCRAVVYIVLLNLSFVDLLLQFPRACACALGFGDVCRIYPLPALPFLLICLICRARCGHH